MKIKDAQQAIILKTGSNVSQGDIAKALNTSRQNISQLFLKNSELTNSKLEQLEKYFNIKFSPQPATSWSDKLGLTPAEYEELLKVLEKDKYKIFICLRAIAGDEQALKDLKKLFCD